MKNLIYDHIAIKLYDEWVTTEHPDVPITTYYDTCDMADKLTDAILKPFRKELIETVMTFDMDDSEVQQITHLYNRYNNINNPDSIEAMTIELYLFLIEQYQMPFHSVVRLIDGSGNMIFTSEETGND